MGLAAGWMAQRRGFEVTILEAGDVGSALRRWGPVRFFTPLAMNLPPALLDELGSGVDPNACMTGDEMREQVLEPLVDRTSLRGAVRTRHRVVSIARRGFTRGDYAGHPLRSERPLLVLADTPEGERYLEADIVFDASGGYVEPLWMGAGGLPARGERVAARWIVRGHAALAAELRRLAGKRVLLVGHGHSAANALLMLQDAGCDVIWSIRSGNQRPVVNVANDPLPERARVVDAANELAQHAAPWLSVRRRSVVESIEAQDESYRVRFFGGADVEVDLIAAFTGFRPDTSLTRELQVSLSTVTEGNDRLWRAISNVTDCLTVPRVDARDLSTEEPGFYFIGARSYGRARTFLLHTGLRHVETILESLSGRA